jgi:GNAT superfamily N-acetyltransferase
MVAVMLETMREFQRAFARSARDGALIELPGVVGCLTPGLAGHSMFNAAVPDDAESLRAALPLLATRYEGRGIGAWGVWTHSSDAAAARVCEDYGLRLDSTPAAMGRDLGPRDFEPPPGVERTGDLDAFDLVETQAWGFEIGTIAAAQPHVLHEYRCYLARDERDAPAAMVGTIHHEGDCGVTLVGTVPQARGRGLATAAMRFALADAARAGCRTTTLQSSGAGHPVYVRLGYREFGEMRLWERRTA